MAAKRKVQVMIDERLYDHLVKRSAKLGSNVAAELRRLAIHGWDWEHADAGPLAPSRTTHGESDGRSS